MSAWQAITSSHWLTNSAKAAIDAASCAQLHAHERLQAQAQAFGIGLGAVAADDAFAFQPLHPAQAGGGGQVHALGQLGIGLAAVALELGEQQQVGAVEVGGGHG